MHQIHIDKIANNISAKFGLTFNGSFDEIEGGLIPVLRPGEPFSPLGFRILIENTSTQAQARFLLDDWAGNLLLVPFWASR